MAIRANGNTWWVKPYKDNEECFMDKDLSVNYNNGVFTFLHTSAHGYVGNFVRFTPNLVILRHNSEILFDGGIVLDYFIESKDKMMLKDELVELSIDAHQAFLHIFHEKEVGKKLHEYEPKFDYSLFRGKLSLIHNSYFDLLP